MGSIRLHIVPVLIFSVIILFGGIFASETRTFSMGQSAGFIRDDSDVNLFPGTLNYYNSLVQTEMRFNGGDNAYSGTVHLPLPNTNFNIGVNINRPIFDLDSFVGLGTYGGVNTVYVNRVTDVLFGMEMNGNNLGFRVSYGTDSFVQDSSFLHSQNIDKSASYMEFAGGLSNEKFDVGASIMLPSVTNELNNDKDELSGFGFNLTGRYFHKINRKVDLVPLVMYGMMSATFDSGGVTTWQDHDITLSNIFVGAALNYYVDEQSTIVLGVHAYSSQSYTEEYKDYEVTNATTTLPAIFIGGESRLASWLLGRLGVMQIFQTETTTVKPKGVPSAEESTTLSTVNFSFGLGIELGDFLIDADLNDGLLFEGPYFISGHNTGDMFGKLSVTYTFGSDNKEEE